MPSTALVERRPDGVKRPKKQDALVVSLQALGLGHDQLERDPDVLVAHILGAGQQPGVPPQMGHMAQYIIGVD
jgi:hypothetical protein